MTNYHPGRRKRKGIMYDLAVGAAFGFTSEDRQRLLPYQRRMALDAIVEADAALKGYANQEACAVAVGDAINRGKNTARGEISSLKAAGFIEFERNSAGVCVKIPFKIKAAFEKLKHLESKIDFVVMVEDKGLTIDATEEINALKTAGVYCGATDEELDAGMEKTIKKALGKEVPSSAILASKFKNYEEAQQ